jgi:hypothetical protein
MIFFDKLCNALTESGVRYAVVGGYAVALHGAVRGTMDVDIAINWNLSTLRKTEAALTGLGLLSRLPISAEDIFRFRDEYVTKRRLIAWNFYDPNNLANQVDVIITFDMKGRTRKRLQTQAGSVYILNIDDLIKMKRASGRKQDIEDAQALDKLK